ncbi:MAG: hypothetical protein Q4D33_04725 [Prevotellaceae bacterium]|nr:hypothetical protein [Prevotellaceae bacterium]
MRYYDEYEEIIYVVEQHEDGFVLCKIIDDETETTPVVWDHEPSHEEFMDGYKEACRLHGPYEERRQRKEDAVIEALMKGYAEAIAKRHETEEDEGEF